MILRRIREAEYGIFAIGDESECAVLSFLIKLGDGCFELKTKRVRIACFWDEGRLIVCSHAFLKKRQKTPEGELRRLEASKRAYFLAKEKGEIRYEY